MKIPYGKSDFAEIRTKGMFYVDKTPFLPQLENDELGYAYLVFLRPRRIGKSSLVNMMAYYYDLARADKFDDLFRGLWVHEHPTPEKNAHVVLHLNLGSVRGANEATVKEGFASCMRREMERTITRYVQYSPKFRRLAEQLESMSNPVSMLYELMSAADSIQKRLYVLIDEYDTFANSLISSGGKNAYESLTEKTGFIRNFYAALKAGTESEGIARIFITGVSPLLLDDLYTGFNISTNITTNWRFNTLAGFTHADVARALDELLSSRPDLVTIPGIGNRASLLETLEEHYDGYRFSEDASERVFNSDMVLYFLRQLLDGGKYPQRMLDPNARTEYQKFFPLFQSTAEPALERRNVLETIMTDGSIQGQLIETFGRTPSPPAREQFISLLFYTGLLTLTTEPRVGWLYKFEIPNLVIRELQWVQFSTILKDSIGIDLGLSTLITAQQSMTVDGSIEAFKEAIDEHVMKVLGLKDYQHFNEKAIKMILITAIVLSNVFHVLSEKEFAQGFCDLFVSPKRDVPHAKYSWLIELKYLQTNATEAEITAAFTDAKKQLAKYSKDKNLVPLLTKNCEMKAVTMVFVGVKEIRTRMFEVETASTAS